MRHLASLLAGFSLLAVLFSPAALAQDEEADLTWAGDFDTNHAFMADAAELYEATEHKTVALRVGPTSAVLGAVMEGSMDFGGSTRAIREITDEVILNALPVAWDGIVVVVHRDNPVGNILVRRLRGVISGEIRNWSELGWDEGGRINYIGREGDAPGIEWALSRILYGADENKAHVATETFESTEGVVDAIENDPSAIGIAMYSYARRQPIKLLTVEGVAASPGTIENGEYVLYQPLYLMSQRNPRKGREIRQFFRFVTSTRMRDIFDRNGLVPYAEAMQLVSHRLRRAEILRNLFEQEEESN